MYGCGHDELKLLRLHLGRLIDGYGRLKRQEVLLINSVSFSQHLPPAILAGRLNTQHRQPGVSASHALNQSAVVP